MKRLLCVFAFLCVFCGGVAFAKGKSKAEAGNAASDSRVDDSAAKSEITKYELSTDIQFGVSWDFADVAPEGASDWQLTGGGPKYEFDARSVLLIKSPARPSVKMGPFLDISADIDSITKGKSSGEPYTAFSGINAQTDLGWRTEFKTAAGSMPLKITADVFGGAYFHHLTEADAAYTPIGADAEAFWSRILPEAGLRVMVTPKLTGEWDASFDSLFISRWNTETQYPDATVWSCKAGFGAQASWKRQLSLSVETNVKLKGDIAWDSGLVYAERKIKVKLYNSYDIDGKLTLRILPVYLEQTEDKDEFGSSAGKYDLMVMGSGVGWASEFADGTISLDVKAPWLASDNASGLAKNLRVWSVSFGWEISK